MSPLHTQLDRVWRRRWLVLAVMVLAVVGTVSLSLTQETTYTGTATLTVLSDERAPEQDAVLTQGYVEYFNQDSSQAALREETALPDDVSFAARISASSPLFYVEATAPDADLAVTSAGALAQTFLEDVNAGVRGGSETIVADLRNQIAALDGRLQNPAVTDQERLLLTQELLSVQGGINELQTGITNQLKNLYLSGGVTSTPPSVVLNAILALVGGLVLGVVIALALSSARNRLVTPHDVRERLGVETLAVIGGCETSAGRRLRAQQLKGLASAVGLSDLARPTALAITSPHATPVSSQVAEEVAAYRALQGERTLLVRADLDPAQRRSEYDGRPGVGEFLAGRAGVELQPLAVAGRTSGMLVVPAGSSAEDPYSLFALDRCFDLVEQARRLADLVVIDVPPVIEAAEAQVLCAVADRTLLVVEEDVTHAADAIEARRRLDQVKATLLGVVIGRSAPSGATAAAEPGVSAAPMVAQRDGSRNGVTASRPTDEVDARA